MSLFALFSKKPKTSTQPTNGKGASKKHRYRGVQVVPHGDACCEAVKNIADERYLLEDAPMLPLPTCDAETCHCTYKRFDDRRADIRRAADMGFHMASELSGQTRRISRSPGRRKEDTA